MSLECRVAGCTEPRGHEGFCDALHSARRSQCANRYCDELPSGAHGYCELHAYQRHPYRNSPSQIERGVSCGHGDGYGCEALPLLWETPEEHDGLAALIESAEFTNRFIAEEPTRDSGHEATDLVSVLVPKRRERRGR